MGMLKTISQAWKVAEIRSKMIFTLLMLVVVRIGSNIPVPNINRTVLSEMFTGETGLFDLFDLFSGGSFSNFTIFALSITPYITASIIVKMCIRDRVEAPQVAAAEAETVETEN